jgi:hypothetical protein
VNLCTINIYLGGNLIQEQGGTISGPGSINRLTVTQVPEYPVYLIPVLLGVIGAIYMGITYRSKAGSRSTGLSGFGFGR